MPLSPLLSLPELVYFTATQRAVLESIGEGLDNKQIAAKLHKKVESIYFHVGALKRKLEIADDRALALWVFQHPDDVLQGRTRDYGRQKKAA